MSIEEAIKALENIPTFHNGYHDKAIDMAVDALEKLNQIIEVLDDTDFNNAVSLNDIGEDKGYCEAICEISIIADDKERWH